MMRRERIRGALSCLAVTWVLMGQVAAQEVAFGGEQKKRPETLPEGVYHVREGDTLWTISSRYLDNPRLWPEIWKENPFVSDPNRIFPGDPLTIPGFGPPPKPLAEAPPVPPIGEERVPPPISPPVEAVAPTDVVEAKRPEMEAKMPEDVIKLPAARPILAIPRGALECSGFVAQNREIVRVGRIIRPLEGQNIRHWYADELFVDLGRRKVQRGDRFQVVRPTSTVAHPATGSRLGVKVRTLGTIEVVSTAGTSPRAKVVYNCEDLATGDLLVEAREWAPPQRGVSRPTDLRLGGTIVGSKDDADSLGQGDILYIDVGQEQGIVPGDEFGIYRMSGVGIHPDSGQAIPLAPVKRGELVVIRTSARAATALLTVSDLSLRVGERLVLFRKMP